MNLLVEVEIKLHTEFGQVWLKIFFWGGVGLVVVGCQVGVIFLLELVQNQILKNWLIFEFCFFLNIFFGGGEVDPIFLHESSSWVEIRLHTEFGRVWLSRS